MAHSLGVGSLLPGYAPGPTPAADVFGAAYPTTEAQLRWLLAFGCCTLATLPSCQHLLILTCLKNTAEDVRVDVCELAETGGKGTCYASNTTLAQSLGLSKPTVYCKSAAYSLRRW
jgi:hypothetical protein